VGETSPTLEGFGLQGILLAGTTHTVFVRGLTLRSASLCAAVAFFCAGCLQVAIITGCNTGLGKESARVLAARGAGTHVAGFVHPVLHRAQLAAAEAFLGGHGTAKANICCACMPPAHGSVGHTGRVAPALSGSEPTQAPTLHMHALQHAACLQG
jgi:hypothetical protein